MQKGGMIRGCGAREGLIHSSEVRTKVAVEMVKLCTRSVMRILSHCQGQMLILGQISVPPKSQEGRTVKEWIHRKYRSYQLSHSLAEDIGGRWAQASLKVDRLSSRSSDADGAH